MNGKSPWIWLLAIEPLACAAALQPPARQARVPAPAAASQSSAQEGAWRVLVDFSALPIMQHPEQTEQQALLHRIEEQRPVLSSSCPSKAVDSGAVGLGEVTGGLPGAYTRKGAQENAYLVSQVDPCGRIVHTVAIAEGTNLVASVDVAEDALLVVPDLDHDGLNELVLVGHPGGLAGSVTARLVKCLRGEVAAIQDFGQVADAPCTPSSRGWESSLLTMRAIHSAMQFHCERRRQDCPAAPGPATLEGRAAALHRSSIVVDGHNDITSTILEDGFDLGKPSGKTHTDLQRLKSGGLSAEFFAIYVDRRFSEHPTALGGGAARRALDMIDITYQQIERHPRDLVLATSVEGIRRAKAEGRIAILMGIEGGHAIENSLFALREFYRLGVRYMTLTHTNTHGWADSCGPAGTVGRHHGLSAFGEEVVREMQRIGMLVDVSHVSDETFEDVIRVAQAPVIASHSSSRSIANVPRNMTDEMLRMVARNGGVVMVNFYTAFLDPNYATAQRRFRDKHKAEIDAINEKYKHSISRAKEEIAKLTAGALPSTPLSVLIDHIEHIAKTAGIDHVGLGADFDGASTLPAGVGGVDGLPLVTLELVRRGYSDEDVRKILGENFLRVMAAAELHAKLTKTSLSGDGSSRRIDRR